jgi:hypothetical protein
MSIGESHKLKQLESRQTVLKAEMEGCDIAISIAASQRERIRRQLTGVDDEIKALKQQAKDPVVTEHAMLRYIERVLGIDLEELKAKILTPEVRGQMDLFGNGTFPGDDCRVVVKDRTVITVKPKE